MREMIHGTKFKIVSKFERMNDDIKSNISLEPKMESIEPAYSMCILPACSYGSETYTLTEK